MWNDTANRRHLRIIAWIFALALSSGPCFAHPMGNFSINHYSKIKIEDRSIQIRYLIDMAEIPTFQDMRQFDMGPAQNSSTSLYLDRQAKVLKAGIGLVSDGHAIHSIRSLATWHLPTAPAVFPP